MKSHSNIQKIEIASFIQTVHSVVSQLFGIWNALFIAFVDLEFVISI